MIDLLLLMLFNAFLINGIYLSTGQDMVFERPARWIEGKVKYWVTKPLFNCPTCMASVHSILPYWYLHEFSQDSMVMYILYVPSLAFLSTYLNRLIEE